jgi:hypothetical protein
MKIDIGGGTAIYASARPDGGATLAQGSSRIRMTKPQAEAVMAAMKTILMPPGQRAEKTTNEQHQAG